MPITRAYCPYCDREAAAEIQSPNHILHLLLTLITSGLWGIVWLVYSLDPAIHCRQCGGRLFNAAGRRRLWIFGIVMVLGFIGCIVGGFFLLSYLMTH